jgi:hypothetical protein
MALTTYHTRWAKGTLTAAAGMVTRRADATPALARITYPSAKLVNVKEMKVDGARTVA